MRRASIITSVFTFLLIILVGLTYYFLQLRSKDFVILGEVAQVRSSLEMAYGANTKFPLSDLPLILGTLNEDSQKLCLTGFESFSTPCDKVILPLVPVSLISEGVVYRYQTVNGQKDYQLEFPLFLNHSKLGVGKGLNCASSQGINPGPCFNQ